MKRKLLFIAVLVAVILVGGYWGVTTYLGDTVKKEMTAEFEKSPMITEFKTEKVTVSLFGEKVRAKGITVNLKGFDAPLKIDESVIVEADTQEQIPNHMHLELNGIHVNAGDDLFALFRPLFEELGYENMSARLELEYDYDATTKTVHVKKLLAGAKGVGELTAESIFTNIDLEKALQGAGGLNPLQMALALPMTNLNRGSVSYKDDSLVNRLYKAEAERNNQPLETVVERALSQYRAELNQKDHPQVQDAMTAIEAFLKDPNRISVTAAPEEPVSFMQLLFNKNFGDLIRLLNLTFEV